MKNASHESCHTGWLIFKASAWLMPGARFGNVPSRVKWPTREEVNGRLEGLGYDPVSASTFAGFKRLYREGRDYQTRNEIHYPDTRPDPEWVPVAFGGQE